MTENVSVVRIYKLVNISCQRLVTGTLVNSKTRQLITLVPVAEKGIVLEKSRVKFLQNLPETKSQVPHGNHTGHHQRPLGGSELQLKSVM